MFLLYIWASSSAQSLKKPPAVQETGSIPALGRSPGERTDKPLQYSCLGNPMDRGAWWATVHGVTRVRQNLATKPPLPNYIHRYANN